jgi:hypothetical protein
MKRNPYSGVTFHQPVVASEMNIPVGQSKSKMVGHNGELNAASKADLSRVVAALMEVANTREVVTAETAQKREELAKLHKEMVTAAFGSRENLVELGEVLADELYLAANRDGFARRFMARQDLNQGSIPIIRLRMKNVVSVTASSPSRVETQLVRDNTYYPPEFYISARPYIERRDIDRSNTDVLEEKYNEALEAIMVGEDRVWRRLAMATVGVANNQTNIVGRMNPIALSTFRNEVTRWNIPAAYWLLANDIWSDLIGDPGFQALIDPVSKHELLLTGELGEVLGMKLISDAFRHPQHKVLDRGEMFIVGDPINHGQYTDRGGVEALPLDGTQESIPGRGWFMSESVSMSIVNARSVARARRV